MTKTAAAKKNAPKTATASKTAPVTAPTPRAPKATKAAAQKTEKTAKAPKAKIESVPSTATNPVALVHAICEKMKGAARKDILAACIAKGINRWTASTQVQKHRAAQKAAAK